MHRSLSRHSDPRRERTADPEGPAARFDYLSKACSEWPDVLCFLALAAGSNVEFDTLALLQRLVAIALDVGIVNEDVFATLACNESEALLGIEELHGTCSQLSLIS